jgi:adenylate cyclase, class 2
MPHGDRETEIKLAVQDVKTALRALRAAGFRVSRRRVFERNTVYDTPGLGLRAAGSLLRIREAGKRASATFKGPAAVARHKSREELELEIPDPAAMGRIFERLGFSPAWRYEKYRTEYRQPGVTGTATLDETPVGTFVELEGAPRWIDRTARAMGFSPRDYITASYARLYLDSCARRNATPGDMVFGAVTGSSGGRRPSPRR